jgi:predicted enzyme related to lactoylglutathione lyase
MSKKQNKPEVRGIGGIFFKTPDPDRIKKWYADKLGLKTDEWGTMFEFRETENPETKAYLQWSPMKQDSDYFQPSQKEFMINYRVSNLAGMIELLKQKGVTILDEIEEYEYGKFIHILDPDGNKIELWEPVDDAF